ncbi:retrotransposon gag domain-containing protein [Artemisia annua]|uniref:Retrotransposon gag domain-containing protein n=1 Tax=Artemisia annua TaxID=35608 RepID=A0A2U1LAD0_ARTAN|nr:retrotransposon gag domain-containing protein [Artemisia annua]
MNQVGEDTPTNVDGSVRNTINKVKRLSMIFHLVHEFCQKHYEQLLPFIAERAQKEKLKDVRSRLSYLVTVPTVTNLLQKVLKEIYGESTEQETNETSHCQDPQGSKRKKKHQKEKSGDYQHQSRETNRKHDRFELLIKTPKEILAMESMKARFVPPPPMTRAPETRNKNKFCEFHRDKGHNTYHSIHLKRQIEEAVKSRQPTHLVKEIKQSNSKGSVNKAAKKLEPVGKEKGAVIFMVQSWQRHTRPVVKAVHPSQMNISFPPLTVMDIEDYVPHGDMCLDRRT